MYHHFAGGFVVFLFAMLVLFLLIATGGQHRPERHDPIDRETLESLRARVRLLEEERLRSKGGA